MNQGSLNPTEITNNPHQISWERTNINLFQILSLLFSAKFQNTQDQIKKPKINYNIESNNRGIIYRKNTEKVVSGTQLGILRSEPICLNLLYNYLSRPNSVPNPEIRQTEFSIHQILKNRGVSQVHGPLCFSLLARIYGDSGNFPNNSSVSLSFWS